ELVEFMSSGVIIAAILEKPNAVSAFRTLIGATNPAQAEAGTIRKLYATSLGENAVHGSDSDENAAIEGNFFFSGLEQFYPLEEYIAKGLLAEAGSPFVFTTMYHNRFNLLTAPARSHSY